MKKVNCAEGIEPQSRSIWAEDGSQQTIPPLCLLLIEAKWYVFLQTALSASNGDSIRFTDECTVKWREQWYYVAHGMAGVTAEGKNCQSERAERENAHIEVIQSCSATNKCSLGASSLHFYSCMCHFSSFLCSFFLILKGTIV